jgi:twitching motility protein PilJ
MKARNSTAGLKSSGPIIGLMVLLVSAIALFITILVITNAESNYDKQYVRHVGELRILNEEIANNARLSVAGSAEGFDKLEQSMARFEQYFSYLINGNPDTGLPGNPELVSEDIYTVSDLWAQLKNDVNSQLINDRDKLIELHKVQAFLGRTLPAIQLAYDKVIAELAGSRAPISQVAATERQSFLVERMQFSVGNILDGGLSGSKSEKFLKTDWPELKAINKALLNGDNSLKISRVAKRGAVNLLEEIESNLQAIDGSVNQMLTGAPALSAKSSALEEIQAVSDKLLDQLLSLDKRFQGLSSERKITPEMGYACGIFALLIVAILGVLIYRETNKSLRVQYDENERSQGAILRLLDEIADLADGDLTTSVTVSEDFTGAIADSINYSIDQLRTLVASINKNSVLVSAAAEDTQGTAKRLAQASVSQAKEIGKVTSSINSIARSMDDVSAQAGDSSKAAEYSVIIANKGAEAVQNTIHGMDKIREQIQKTSKQIKRLGESSQEIGDIVSLINDIADQTNILSLNAAIQASMAGEAGRGFAVVADEVQRLAERSGAATKQIEVLVKAIQADTNDAVISMEQTTTEVVQGARLAQDAGVALGEIEKVSDELANLIKEISAAALAQSAAANQVSSTMNVIQEITSQTSSGVTATASSIGNLAEMAKEMRSTVAGFTLPESEHDITTEESDDSGEMESADEQDELAVKADEVFLHAQPGQNQKPAIADFEVDVATGFGKDGGRETALSSTDSNEDSDDSQNDDKDKRNVSAA